MAQTFTSLLVISLVAILAPLVAQSIPRKPVPETVLLLVAGAALGPYAAGVVVLDDAVSLLSELGLAFLFLLAGYEIDPRELMGEEGRRGLWTWVASFAIAFVVALFIPVFAVGSGGATVTALVLTTTALGTLMPILAERGLMGTRVGGLVIKYGTWGELGPVLAMALLLSARSKAQTAAILLALVALCVLIAWATVRAKHTGSRVYAFLAERADSTSQTFVRAVLLLLIALVAFSEIFDLDAVLGAFAAGFVLRFVMPEGNKALEDKIDGIAYGFFIPLFFVVSGAKIDMSAVGAAPGLLVLFIVMLLVVRMVPIYVALSTGRTTRDMSPHNKLSVALYCTTALPVVVAVTSVAQSSGIMGADVASVLVAAAAVSVLLMPLLAAAAYRVSDAHPVEAVREMREDPDDRSAILHEHLRAQRQAALKRHDADVERVRRRHERFVSRVNAFADADLDAMDDEELAELDAERRSSIAATKRLLGARERMLRSQLGRVEAMQARAAAGERLTLSEWQAVVRGLRDGRRAKGHGQNASSGPSGSQGGSGGGRPSASAKREGHERDGRDAHEDRGRGRGPRGRSS